LSFVDPKIRHRRRRQLHHETIGFGLHADRSQCIAMVDVSGQIDRGDRDDLRWRLMRVEMADAGLRLVVETVLQLG